MNRFAVFLSIVSLVFIGPVSAQEAEVKQPQVSPEEAAAIVKETVAKARQYLGGEKALNAVKSIHYKGVLVYGNGQSGTIESIFMKPNYHQAISVIGNQKETSTLNRTEAWQKVERVDQPGSWTLNIYQLQELRAMQATVADTLSFLNTPPVRNGRIEYLGTETIDGRELVVLYYAHGRSRGFHRYIDRETGEVVHMINQNGAIMTTSGEQWVDGVRFPEKLVAKFITQFGVQTIEITYTSIDINESFDTDRFNVPVLTE
ncbi:hypothetical protein [Pelagicoccus sp. SDUM812003]|uniref:hypothetical protein n=1 Tax=Pelagicoccus sp. SDUM812003 TaxID=3041267 RepID=UPI00280E91A5|nr:hypothetical protein [Pelagicoccus sp. SDUM812003]MDQ8204827.1 hypothetical protein [Pelagicoccus sp. SDUM812003]